MSRLRVAVAGVGSLGQHHARIAAGSEAVELVAVVDPAEARGREIAARFGTGWAPALGEVLDRVDAVQIAESTELMRADLKTLGARVYKIHRLYYRSIDNLPAHGQQ